MSQKQQEEKKKEALDYHSSQPPGKLEISATKPCVTQHDLSLAYSPGVAHPCMEIAKNTDLAFRYTARGNLVGVVSNGSAVLGLGNIGPLAGKPVMEGKAVLFKKFADVDVFDIEIDESSVDGMVSAIKAIAPTFGGINLEDIKAPECFEVERRLEEMLDIPVFHDDQHGTAIIASAAFLNALEIARKRIARVKVVFSGAGSASIACARLFLKMGVKRENLILCDSKGVVYQGRTAGMNPYKEEFALDTSLRTLEEAMVGADAFIGCSVKGILSQAMAKSMAKRPIIFAMANPEPEILPEDVEEVRSDAIMATGRSDYPNQVNNVLGFPFIFRGALDVRAKKINEEMKLAAVHALANLAKEEVPEEVAMVYGNISYSFGREYLIPKPFDKRVLSRLAPAIAKAAMESGVAREPIADLTNYARMLDQRLFFSASFIKSIRDRLGHKSKSRIVFAEGANTRILRAVKLLVEDGHIRPILLGQRGVIHQRMEELGLDHLKSEEVICPDNDPRYQEFAHTFFQRRMRKGISQAYAADLMAHPNYFGAMLVREGHADGLITGATQNYPECAKPILRVIETEKGQRAAGVIIMAFRNKVLFLADCTMQMAPTAYDLSKTAIATSELYRNMLGHDPRVAFLSYSNFGSNRSPSARTVADAVAITKEQKPQLVVDGEVQADVAVNQNIMQKLFSFSTLDAPADVLIFPDLNSSNISYKLLAQLGDATPIGPILMPMKVPANVVQRTSTVTEIVNMATVTALMAQTQESRA